MSIAEETLSQPTQEEVKRKPSSLARAVLTVFTGSALAMLVPFALAPFLSRLYTPDDFGQAGFYMAVVSAVGVVATGRYEYAVLITRRDSHALNLAMVVIGLLFSSFVLGVCIVAMLRVFFPVLDIYYTIPLAVTFLGLTSLLDRYNNRLRKYYRMSMLRLVRCGSDGAVAVALGLFWKVGVGLIIGWVSGYVISSLVALYVTCKSVGVNRAAVHRIRMAVLVKRYKAFPQYNMPHALVNSLAGNFPLLLLPAFFPDSLVGLYAFGVRIVQAPISLLSSSISTVLTKEMAEAHAKNMPLSDIFRKQFLNLAVLSLLFLPFALFAPKVFSVVFGEHWASAGEYIQILTPFFMLNFIAAAFAMVPSLFNRQKTALAIELLFSSVKMVALVSGGLLGSITMSLAFYSISSSLVIMLNLYWIFRLVSSSREVKDDSGL